MTKKKLICRISNGFGNQMFMYAASYSFSKQLNCKLFLDTFSGINQDIKKTVKKGFKHYKPRYELSVFNLTTLLSSSKVSVKRSLRTANDIEAEFIIASK